MSTETLMVFCTFPDMEKARQIGTDAVDSQLAACVNLRGDTTSIYRWQGKTETAIEVLAIFKTTEETFPTLSRFIRHHHPYTTPEIVALPITAADPDYLEWLTRHSTPVG